jgi:hypothetical protein
MTVTETRQTCQKERTHPNLMKQTHERNGSAFARVRCLLAPAFQRRTVERLRQPAVALGGIPACNKHRTYNETRRWWCGVVVCGGIPACNKHPTNQHAAIDQRSSGGVAWWCAMGIPACNKHPTNQHATIDQRNSGGAGPRVPGEACGASTSSEPSIATERSASMMAVWDDAEIQSQNDRVWSFVSSCVVLICLVSKCPSRMSVSFTFATSGFSVGGSRKLSKSDVWALSTLPALRMAGIP